jgi:hypothetical protein
LVNLAYSFFLMTLRHFPKFLFLTLRVMLDKKVFLSSKTGKLIHRNLIYYILYRVCNFSPITRLPKKPSLWLFSIPIPKFSISFAMKRDRKGDKSHPFLKPAYNSLKNSTAQIFSEIIFFKVKIKNT